MKKIYTIFALALAANTANAQDFYVQKQNEVEFKRISQEIQQVKLELEQKSTYIRELEASNEKLVKQVKDTNKKVDDLVDLWVNFENVSLPNLISSDKALAERINDTNTKITQQTSIWNWGEQTRECPGIGKHQQVRTVLTPDGAASIQYLCFDGRVLHLNTNSNIPPVE